MWTPFCCSELSEVRKFGHSRYLSWTGYDTAPYAIKYCRRLLCTLSHAPRQQTISETLSDLYEIQVSSVVFLSSSVLLHQVLKGTASTLVFLLFITDTKGCTYLFDLDYDKGDQNLFTVDAFKYGNVSHFINHSCDPNLIVYNVWINCLDPDLPRLALFASQDIKKGEEITFDYNAGTARLHLDKSSKCVCINCFDDTFVLR